MGAAFLDAVLGLVSMVGRHMIKQVSKMSGRELRAELTQTRDILKGYARHVGHCEGINFIDGCDHHHPTMNDEQWARLKELV